MGWIEDYPSGAIQWQNEEEGKTTPITAEVLQRYENTIAELCQEVKTLRDSVSPTTDWVPVWQSDSISMKARRIGRTAWLEAESYGGFQIEANRWKDVSRLPDGFAPSTTIHGVGIINGERPLSVSIQTDGLIRAHGSISGSYWMFSMSWPVG